MPNRADAEGRMRGDQSTIQQRIQHLHDHDQQIVKRPIRLCIDAVRTKVRPQMANRFFGFAASDLERVIPRTTPLATERFTDVRAYRLD